MNEVFRTCIFKKEKQKRENRIDIESYFVLPMKSITLWIHDLIQKKKKIQPHPRH